MQPRITVSTPASLERRGDLAHRSRRLLPERVVALDQRHEPRAGDGDDLDAGVDGRDERRVAAARDGRLGREQPDPPVARRERGRVRLGLEHADDGHGERPLEVGQRGRGRGVAGDDDELHALSLEEPPDLEREAADLLERARARTGSRALSPR